MRNFYVKSEEYRYHRGMAATFNRSTRTEKPDWLSGDDIDYEAPMVTVTAARVLRWTMQKENMFSDYFGACVKEVKFDKRRVMKAVTFLYLMLDPSNGEIDPEEEGTFIHIAFPQIFRSALTFTKGLPINKMDDLLLNLGFVVFLYHVGVDHQLWDATTMLQGNGGILERGPITLKDFADGKGNDHVREAFAFKANAKLIDGFKESVPRIVKSVFKLTNHMCLDRALNSNINRFRDELGETWTYIRYIYTMFFCHTSISQPTLLAALLYTAITKPRPRENSIENSRQLKEKYPALHRIFYMVLECAQIPGSPTLRGLPRMEDCDIYSRGEGSPGPSATTKKNNISNKSPPSSNGLKSPKQTGGQITSSPVPSEYEGPTVRVEEAGEGELVATVCNYKLPRKIKEKNPQCAIWTISDLPFHICCHETYFSDFKPVRGKALVRNKRGELPYKDSLHRIDGTGTVKVKVRNTDTNTFVTFTLKDVYYVPSMNCNIMSLPLLGATVKYDTGSFEMDFKKGSGSATVEPQVEKIYIKSMLKQRYWFFDYSKGQSYTEQQENIPDIQQVMKSQGLTKMSYKEQRSG